MFPESASWSMQSDVGQLVEVSQSVDMSLGALGALKARAGYAQGPFMTYLTGGLAGGHAKATLDKQVAGLITAYISPSATEEVSGLVLGATAGAGVAWQPAPGVALSAETLYYRFLTDLNFSDGQSVSVNDAWSATARLSFKLD